MKTTASRAMRGILQRQKTNCVVRLDYLNPRARSVYLAGTFNAWRPNSTEMIHLEFGHWAKELALAPGTYEYRLVVDGRWLPDPSCPASAPNPYGERNSILTVPPENGGYHDEEGHNSRIG